MDFSSLGLSEPLIRAALSQGWSQPTAVQQAAIPVVVSGANAMVAAHTGTGKTAAYILPLLEILESSPPEVRGSIPVLIVVPTRQLAQQIEQLVVELAGHLSSVPKVCLAVGGVSINPQQMALRGGADVVVGTPGRLLDLVEHNALNLSGVQMLVFDEADRLLSSGFADESSRVLSLLPPVRQSLLFSATLDDSVRRLAGGGVNEPVLIDLAHATEPNQAIGYGPATIEQRAIRVDAEQRTSLLVHLLSTDEWSQVLVFVDSRRRAQNLAAKLCGCGVDAAALHGELSQGARTQALDSLKHGSLRVLVATDLAARGLDVPQLPVVVNYELPRSTADYVHRIGRTGRAGRRGVAMSFVHAANEGHFQLICKRNHLVVELEQLPGFEPTEAAVLAPLGPGGLKGRRKSKKDKLREAQSKGSGES